MEQGCAVIVEPVVPTASATAEESRMDLAVRVPGVAQQVYVDVTVADATSAEALARNAADRDGAAAQALEQKKRAKYPGITVTPFVVEAHGRLGDAAVGLAKLVAPREPEARSMAIAALYQRIASILQRTQADAVLTATRP